MSKPIDRLSAAFVVAVALAIALGCDKGKSSRSGSSGEGSKPTAPEVKVSAAELLQAYEGNEVAADARFKGKVVEVTGIVGDIKKDILDDIYVTIGTGKELEIPEVQCFVADGMAGKAGGLAKGAKITAVGTVDGLMMNVLVKDCRF